MNVTNSSKIEESKRRAAYSAFACGFKEKLTYFSSENKNILSKK